MESVFTTNHPGEYADQNDTVENLVTHCRKITTQDYVSSLCKGYKIRIKYITRQHLKPKQNGKHIRSIQQVFINVSILIIHDMLAYYTS